VGEDFQTSKIQMTFKFAGSDSCREIHTLAHLRNVTICSIATLYSGILLNLI